MSDERIALARECVELVSVCRVLTGQERTLGQDRELLDRAKLCLSAVRQLPAGAMVLTAETK